MGLLWLAVSTLFYGLDFSVGSCQASEGCDRYRQSLLTTLVDVPGYLIGSLLADALGRRTAASLSLLVGGGALLLSPALARLGAAATAAAALVGKLGASSGFIQAYLFPAELFATPIRGTALGVANVFARTGTVVVPLLATAPVHQVQLLLGSLAVLAAFTTLLLPERGGLALPD